MRLEDEIHERCVSELRRAFASRGYSRKECPFFHCPNEGRRSRAHAAKLDRLGLSSGVPDLVIAYPTAQGKAGAALELKAKSRAKPSPTQKVWLAHFESIGFATSCAGGHKAAAEILAEWGYIHPSVIPLWLASTTR